MGRLRATIWLAIALGTPGCSVLFDADSPGESRDDETDVSADAGGELAALPRLDDDFERGEMSDAWSGIFVDNGDSCEVTTNVAYTGNASLLCRTDSRSGSAAYVYLDFEPVGEVYVRAAVRFSAIPQQWVAFVQASNIGTGSRTRLLNADLYNNRLMDVWSFSTSDWDYSDSSFDVDQWYLIDFSAHVTPGGEEVTLSVDGTPEARVTTGAASPPINQIAIGSTLLAGPNEALDIYIDDVIISDTPIP